MRAEVTHYLGLDGWANTRSPACETLVLDLAECLSSLGVMVCGVFVHQLAQPLSVKCPHGNSSYSLAIDWQPLEMSTINDVETALEAAPELQLESLCLQFLHARTPHSVGAFCVASRSQLQRTVEEFRIFASRVQQEYVPPREALQLCERANILLEQLSPHDQGVVGALAALVLNHSGQGKSLALLRPKAEFH